MFHHDTWSFTGVTCLCGYSKSVQESFLTVAVLLWHAIWTVSLHETMSRDAASSRNAEIFDRFYFQCLSLSLPVKCNGCLAPDPKTLIPFTVLFALSLCQYDLRTEVTRLRKIVIQNIKRNRKCWHFPCKFLCTETFSFIVFTRESLIFIVKTTSI
jgi:hypothetical protein